MTKVLDENDDMDVYNTFIQPYETPREQLVNGSLDDKRVFRRLLRQIDPLVALLISDDVAASAREGAEKGLKN